MENERRGPVRDSPAVGGPRGGDSRRGLAGSRLRRLSSAEYAGRSMGHHGSCRPWSQASPLSLVRDNNLSMPPDQVIAPPRCSSRSKEHSRSSTPISTSWSRSSPPFQEVITDQLSPRALGKRALKIATQYAELFADLPKEVRRGIYSVKTGNLKLRIELSQFEQLQRGRMRGARLLALASIASRGGDRRGSRRGAQTKAEE